jgi:ketosteroid isomerase-like protein
MKILSVLSFLLCIGLFADNFQSKKTAFNITLDDSDNRLIELDNYWESLAKTASEGDFEGMKSLYHEDAVVVKSDTTFAVSEAFRVRWKDEIMEVNQGLRINTLDFRFSKRIGDQNTAFEKGIFHYTSIESTTDSVLTDTYVHFETLLVKVNNRWVALMENQQQVATIEEWRRL